MSRTLKRRALRSTLAIFLAITLMLGTCVLAHATPEIVFRHTKGDGKKRIALTFDDGPHPRYTPLILDILKKYEVHATFFTVGMNVETYGDLIAREISEGHEIGNHTYHHYHTKDTDGNVLIADILACSKAIEEKTGKQTKLFRPPEGVCTDEIKALCEEMGYTIVMWSIDTRDWAHTPACEIIANIEKNVCDGAIILMHDFTGKNSPTPAVLRQIIPKLQRSGYEFVTVSQLLKS